MPPMGFDPIAGNTSLVSHALSLLCVVAAQLGPVLVIHARATDSKVLVAASALAYLSSRLAWAGSMPSASRSLAASRRCRALAKVTAG